MSRSHFAVVGAAFVLLLFSCQAARVHAQAIPTATRSGGYISVGATFSSYQSLYDKDQVAGGSVYADANLTRRYGLEGEARLLDLNTESGTKTLTYLVGPRVSISLNRFRPYVKGLVGTGKFTYPYGYAHGSYLVIAPGAGLDIAVLHGRANLRVIDFEYQDWHQFTFGQARPYGISSGLSIRVF